MAKNTGKNFESIIKSNAPSYLKVTRIPDPPQSFTKRSDTRFSKKNPYDFEAFDSVHRINYCLELKSVSQKYLTYHTSEDDEKDKKSANIQWHQIDGLTKASEYDNVVAGFLLNFRLDNGEQLLYFLNIKDFNRLRKNTTKKSMNIMDIVLFGGIKINGEKLRVNYRWDLDEFLKSQSKNYPL
jgi:penicillin-binding protein-related factor A (putative recombinase)